MPLIPLGIQLREWAAAGDPSKTDGNDSNGGRQMFTDNNGGTKFRVIQTGSKPDTGVKDSAQKLVSPVQRVLEQVKEREKINISDAPDANQVSLDMAAVSTGIRQKKKAKKTVKRGKNKKGNPFDLNRLINARKTQSGSGRGRGKKGVIH